MANLATRRPVSMSGELLAFLVPTFLLATLGVIAGRLIAERSHVLDMLLIWWFQWSPGLSAIVVTLFFRGDLRGLGWRRPKFRYLMIGYAIPIAMYSAVYGLVWLLGWGQLNLDLARNPAFLLMATTIRPWGAVVGSLGEEIGWRGFLVPRLVKSMSYAATSVTAGAIWACWHFPAIALAGRAVNGVPLLYALVCFSALAIGISFVYTWLRL